MIQSGAFLQLTLTLAAVASRMRAICEELQEVLHLMQDAVSRISKMPLVRFPLLIIGALIDFLLVQCPENLSSSLGPVPPIVPELYQIQEEVTAHEPLCQTPPSVPPSK